VVTDPRKYPRSWSQLGDWECPEAFRLGRIEKVWKRPAAWFAMGTGVHAAIEWWERAGRPGDDESVAGMIDEFDRVYSDEINKDLDQTPNTDLWMWSGQYDGGVDIERRRIVGRTHIGNTLAYYDKHPDEKPWILPDGRPAIELDFEFELGSVSVRGKLDMVVDRGDGALTPRDNKTGTKVGDPRQLKLTGIALEEFVRFVQGVEPEPITRGDFLMTKTGSAKEFDLTEVSRDDLTVMFETMDAEVRAGNFVPNPSPDRCRRCPVKDSCRFRED
jgi:putative RecB family exonuclease